MPSQILKRKQSQWVRVGGTQQTGWLPANGAQVLPAPVRDLRFTITIESDGTGYLLCVVAHDRSLYADTWHATLAAAEETADAEFGVRVWD